MIKITKRLIAAQPVLQFKIPLDSRPYKHANTTELINSYAVFKLSSYKILVDNVPNLIKFAKNTGTSFILHAIVKRTFFRHFCGGENLAEVVPTMDKLAKSNIGSILDLAMEADLDSIELTGEAAKENTKHVVSLLKDSIEIAAHQPGSFIAVKITSLVPPSLLHSWTSTLEILRREVMKISQNGEINLAQFQSLEKTFPLLKTLDLADIFAKNDLDKNGTLNFADLSAIFSISKIENCKALVNLAASVRKGDRPLNNSDLDTAKLVFDEIKVLCDLAKAKQVKLMMDAEQTYFQTAIDSFVISMCQLYNPKNPKDMNSDLKDWKSPIVYNTYQMYLKGSVARLKADINRAEQQGYSFGVKLVRGAYMVAERERASQIGIPSPIHDNIEDSHNSYNEGVKFTIEKQNSFPPPTDFINLSMVVATHNHQSIEYASNLMEKKKIPKLGGWVM